MQKIIGSTWIRRTMTRTRTTRTKWCLSPILFFTYIHNKNKIIILRIHEICVCLCLQFWGWVAYIESSPSAYRFMKLIMALAITFTFSFIVPPHACCKFVKLVCAAYGCKWDCWRCDLQDKTGGGTGGKLKIKILIDKHFIKLALSQFYGNYLF